MQYPFTAEQISDNTKSEKIHFPIDPKLPEDILRVANSMEQIVDIQSVFVLRLHEDGTFNRSDNITWVKPNDRRSYLESAMEKGWPIKVENMESYNFAIREVCHELERISKKPVNCHMFVGQAGFGSFGWHNDDDNVWAYLVSGQKTMETSFTRHDMEAGDWVVMPKGIQHKAENLSSNILLSFGNYSFWEDSVVLG